MMTWRSVLWGTHVAIWSWLACAGCAAPQTSASSSSIAKTTIPPPSVDVRAPPDDGRTLRWDRSRASRLLKISDDGSTLSWQEPADATWLSAQTTGRLKDGVCSWEFDIGSIADGQIGVGAMLEPPNWGLFGYLGAGINAWAYDAHDGAIVTETEDLHKNLPTIEEHGTVTVTVDLIRELSLTFSVNGVKAPAIPLPRGATVIPAATLLKRGQVVTLRNFQPCQR